MFDDIIEELKIGTHLRNHIRSQCPSISLDDLYLDTYDYEQIFSYHILINLLGYEGEIPKSIGIIKDEDGDNGVIFILNAPLRIQTRKFRKTLENLVENYNLSQENEICFPEYESIITAPESTLYLKYISYHSIKPFFSEEQIKTTIEQKFDFIARFIIEKNLENLEKINENYQLKKNNFLLVYPHEATKLEELFIDKLTEDQKQTLLRFEAYLKTYKGSIKRPHSDITKLYLAYPWSGQKQEKVMLEVLASSLTILSTLIGFADNHSSEILQKLKEGAEYSFKPDEESNHYLTDKPDEESNHYLTDKPDEESNHYLTVKLEAANSLIVELTEKYKDTSKENARLKAEIAKLRATNSQEKDTASYFKLRK
ncbi:MAG: hypothetical protein RLY40_1064 [Pseudomonadota bacterium]|jgi:hypothetical protein